MSKGSLAVTKSLSNRSDFSDGSDQLDPDDAGSHNLAWSPVQRRIAEVLESPRFDLFVFLVVMCNMVLVVVETDQLAQCLTETEAKNCATPTGIVAINWSMLVFYTGELCLQLYVYRVNFFDNIWNTADLVVVFASILAEVIGSMFRNLKALRLLRLLRLMRLIRLLSSFRELYTMLHGMVATMRAVIWAGLLMFGLITVWSIVAVDILYPEVRKVAAAGGYSDCDWCVAALSSVYDADLTLFEITVLGENWGQLVLPLAQSKGGWVFALIIFFGVFFSVVIGLMNLVLAVVVDFAVESREDDQKMQSMLKEKGRVEARKQLREMCALMDTDQGGTLTFGEFMQAYDHSPQFRSIMEFLDVDREDIDCVFKIMDSDHSGDISYNEFADLLYKMKTQSSKTHLLFIKHHTMEIRRNVEEELELVKNQVAVQLSTNTYILEQMARKMGISVQVQGRRIATFKSDRVQEDVSEPTILRDQARQGSWLEEPDSVCTFGKAHDVALSELSDEEVMIPTLSSAALPGIVGLSGDEEKSAIEHHVGRTKKSGKEAKKAFLSRSASALPGFLVSSGEEEEKSAERHSAKRGKSRQETIGSCSRQASKDRPELSPEAMCAKGSTMSAPEKHQRRSMFTVPMRKEAIPTSPEADRLEKLSMQIETGLAGLQREVLRRMDERCDALATASRQTHESQERFGGVLFRVQADQKILLAVAEGSTAGSLAASTLARASMHKTWQK